MYRNMLSIEHPLGLYVLSKGLKRQKTCAVLPQTKISKTIPTILREEVTSTLAGFMQVHYPG